MKQKKCILLVLMLMLCMTFAGCSKEEKAEKEIKGVEDLSGSRIGVQIGTTGDILASDYENDDAGTTVTKYNKGTDAVQALKQNKIDCIIIDAEPAKAFVELNQDLMILEEAFAIEEYAIAISKDNPELKDAINEALKELVADGTIDAIKKNYTGTDEEKGNFPYKKKDVARENGTIVMATNAAFPPYEYYENEKIVGFDADMMQAICDKLGMELEIEDMEFDSIITAVQSAENYVGAAGMTVTEDRLKTIDFSTPYTTSSQVMIVRNPDGVEQKLSFAERFENNFVKDQRWKYLTKGLANTIIITFFAILIGIVLGFLIAIIRTSYDLNGSFKFLNLICKIYLTIMRGTPVMVQILIIYFVIFVSVDISKIVVAVIAFGLNSAAYVSEIVRSGIMAVDPGQFEAGRSLGLNYRMTMIYIILPQAIKNILPALGNEFINLLKETSISGYIGLADLTRGGVIIQSLTYEAFMPLIAVALIYLVIVMLLTAGVNRLERSLKKNER